MVALCVDDEILLLKDLLRAVNASPDIEKAVGFQKRSEAIAWASENKPDIAFLDVNLRGCTGLELAQELLDMWPDLSIVFCTGYKEYAVEAFKLHAAGYLVKPVVPADIQTEIENIKSRITVKPNKLLTVQCFGNFEVFKDDKPLYFKRKRSKEVLAYLIDRRGAAVTIKEICTALWEDDASEKNTMHLYKIMGDLKSALQEVGAESVLIKNKTEYSVDVEKIDCDYYKYLAGDPAAERAFLGEYMMQYSWAEETTASLY